MGARREQGRGCVCVCVCVFLCVLELVHAGLHACMCMFVYYCAERVPCAMYTVVFIHIRHVHICRPYVCECNQRCFRLDSRAGTQRASFPSLQSLLYVSVPLVLCSPCLPPFPLLSMSQAPPCACICAQAIRTRAARESACVQGPSGKSQGNGNSAQHDWQI